MKYKYELHCHTKEVSMCSMVEAETMVNMYAEAGYNGVVITDHYSPLTFRNNHLLSPQKIPEFYLAGYRKAKAAAPKGFTVLLGMELRFYATANDYLLYGIDEGFLTRYGNLMTKYPKKIHEIAEKEGFLFVQAHPFRNYIIRTNEKYLSGAEVFNGKGDHNDKAEKWASDKNMKIRTSGSDFHRVEDFAKGGIITNKEIKTNDDLISVLSNNDFKLIKNE